MPIGRLKGDYVTADAARRLDADLGRAIRKVLLSTHRLAPSVVGLPTEKVEQRLKDQEESVLAQLDIMDRTFRAWKEMANHAEQTLGGIQESRSAALAEPV